MGTVKIMLVQEKYNYPEKVCKALMDGNKKYLKSVQERGKMVIVSEKEQKNF